MSKNKVTIGVIALSVGLLGIGAMIKSSSTQRLEQKQQAEAETFKKNFLR